MRTGAPFRTCARTALISSCGHYRYLLGRCWSKNGDQIVWIMLNPSKADGQTDDPTIRRCMSFSRAWGYGGIIVVNLFALRATDPDELDLADEPVGPDNDRHIAQACTSLSPLRRPVIIAAWGAHPRARARALHVLSLVGHDVWCLGMTRSGHPRHPLYVTATQQPTSYHARVAR